MRILKLTLIALMTLAVKYQQVTSYQASELSGKIFRFRPDLENPVQDFILKFNLTDSNLEAILIGSSPEEEHGVFYFFSHISRVQLNGKNISFKFSKGELYEKPITLSNYQQLDSTQSSGFDRNEIEFMGIIKGNNIEFNCKSDSYSCYTDLLIFKTESN